MKQDNIESKIFNSLKKLASPNSTKKYDHGEQILSSSTASETLFLLDKGDVKLKTLSGDVVRLSAPNVIGEISFLSGLPVVADVFAEGQVSVINLKQEDFDGSLAGFSTSRDEYRLLSKLALFRTTGQYHQKYIALVAHDNKKDALSDFVQKNSQLFSIMNLVSTENTSKRIEERTDLRISKHVKSGPLGGDQEVGSMIARGLIDAVFFFIDPLWAAPHSADVIALGRLCDVSNIPLATNIATAEAIIGSLKVKYN